jgi:hypothetical protein
MKALICPNEVFAIRWIVEWTRNDNFPNGWEPVYSDSEIVDCQRIAQVEPDDNTFDVAPPLYWVDCPEECEADYWYYKDGQCFKRPVDAEAPLPVGWQG